MHAYDKLDGVFACSWALEAVVIHRMQAAVHADTDDTTAAPADAAAAAGSGPDFAGLSDAEHEASVEVPMDADVQLSRVQLMRLRMRRQLAAQLACSARNRVFLEEELDLLDVECGVGAFVNKFPPTINAGVRRVTVLLPCCSCVQHNRLTLFLTAASMASLKTRFSVSPSSEFFVVSCGKLLGCIRRNDVNSGVWQY